MERKKHLEVGHALMCTVLTRQANTFTCLPVTMLGDEDLMIKHCIA